MNEHRILNVLKVMPDPVNNIDKELTIHTSLEILDLQKLLKWMRDHGLPINEITIVETIKFVTETKWFLKGHVAYHRSELKDLPHAYMPNGAKAINN